MFRDQQTERQSGLRTASLAVRNEYLAENCLGLFALLLLNIVISETIIIFSQWMPHEKDNPKEIKNILDMYVAFNNTTNVQPIFVLPLIS